MTDYGMEKGNGTELDSMRQDISVELIDLNEDNEAIFGYEDVEHLATRMKENGFYGAIEVYAKKDGRYEIASGHRRYLAWKSLGNQKIPCIVSKEVGSKEKAKHLIEANIHNRAMTPLRWAKAIAYYEENVLKTKKVVAGSGSPTREMKLAKVFHMSEDAVKDYKLILELIPELQECTDRENFPYRNLIDLTQYDETQQRETYERLLRIADGDIGTLSKTIISQVAKSTVNQKADDRRKNKSIYSPALKDCMPEKASNADDEEESLLVEDEDTAAFEKVPDGEDRYLEKVPGALNDEEPEKQEKPEESEKKDENTEKHIKERNRALHLALNLAELKEQIQAWSEEEQEELKNILNEIFS